MESSSIAQKMRARLPLILLVTVVLMTTVIVRGMGADSGDYATSLSRVLLKKGLTVDPSQVIWLEKKTGPFRTRSAVFVGRNGDELDDIYYVDARTAGKGSVLDVWWLRNITRTSSAAEHHLARIGSYVAYGVQLGETYDAVVILDTKGESKKLTEDWPVITKLQNAITNLQDSGRLQGFERDRFGFKKAATRLDISVDNGRFAINADDDHIVIDPETSQVVENSAKVEFQPMVKSQPGKVTWAVDTVRNISWIGPHFVEWLEHTVFSLTDKSERIYHRIVGTTTETSEVLQELGIKNVDSKSAKLLTYDDPNLGWPPAKLTPADPPIGKPVPGEGEWIPVVDEDFVNAYPNAPPAFYQTFIRVDPEREYVRVYVTLWDPRQVQLHIVMGTREPESATGKTGTGMIPRDPRTMRNLVGAFNGGFQALHGEFGMMADGQVYLPPKPWAATVAVFDNGKVGIGSWPGFGRNDWDEDAFNRQIPKDMISMRQNLTSVVEDGKYNPWQRWWWGAAPPWVKDQTYIYRSGICITQESFFAYFWGESMGPDELGKAMIKARCVRGMHLDMNSKHTGFEFYKPLPRNVKPGSLGRKLTDAEFEGPLPDNGNDVLFRARKAVTKMTPLRFPRYLESDPRDYFYLTLKPVLPGPAFSADGRSISFSTSGLPHSGWPHTFARAHIEEKDGSRTWLVRIDPLRGVPNPLADKQSNTTLAYLSGVHAGVKQAELAALHYSGVEQEWAMEQGDIALYAVHEKIRLDYKVGWPEKGAHLLFAGPALSITKKAMAAMGVDDDGFLVYCENESGNGSTLQTRLRDAGVQRAVALPRAARLAFLVDGSAIDVSGSRKIRIDPRSSIAIQAEERPAAEVIFPDTKPKPYRVWGWLQGRRFRYFPTGAPRFPKPEELDEEM